MKFKHMISGKTAFIFVLAAVILTAFFAWGGKLKAPLNQSRILFIHGIKANQKIGEFIKKLKV